MTAGYWTEVGRYWRTAQRAARSSEDRALSSLVGGRRAVFSLYGPGSHTTALSLADDALAIGGDRASAGTASAYVAQAQILALHGDQSGAHAALSRLETMFDRLDDRVRSDTKTVWGWSEQRLNHVQSFVHSYTGNVSQAIAAQDAALIRYPGTGSLGAAQVQFHRAVCMIASGDPSQGARHAADVFQSLAPEFRNGYMRTSATLVLDALPDQAERLPAVRQMREMMSPASQA